MTDDQILKALNKPQKVQRLKYCLELAEERDLTDKKEYRSAIDRLRSLFLD